MSEQLSDIQKVMRINRHAVTDDGQLASIVQQFANYHFAKAKDPERANREFMPLVLVADCGIYDVPELAGKPLIAFNSAIEHIEERHGGTIDELALLPNELRQNLLVFQDPDQLHHFSFVLQQKSSGGNRFLAVMDVETQANAIAVNRLITCHGKRDLDHKILRSLEMGLSVYTNVRTAALLGDAGMLGSAEPELGQATRELLSHAYYSRFRSFAAQYGVYPDEITAKRDADARALIEGGGCWNVDTFEAIFHDPDFDIAGTYGITSFTGSDFEFKVFDRTIAHDAFAAGAIWEAYDSSRDEYISRGEAIARVADEDGWISANLSGDEILEYLWKERLCDVPMSEDKRGALCLDSDWLVFDAGTTREEIWEWFDMLHSKGVAWLMGQESEGRGTLDEAIAEAMVSPQGACEGEREIGRDER